MRVGIEAGSIRAGGGLTHLSELLRAAEPEEQGISRVTIWSGWQTLSQLPDRPWLQKIHVRAFDGSIARRVAWQHARLERLAKQSCDVLWFPAGVYTGHFRPFVTLSQNMLPFDARERRRFSPLSRTFWRLEMLHVQQSASFRRADGRIYLTEYARRVIEQQTGSLAGPCAVIAHGIDPRFHLPPRTQLPLSAYSPENPFRLLYVSIVNVYKHQWAVVEAVANLRRQGMPVQLDLVGPAYAPALKRLRAVMERCDPGGEFVRYHAAVPFTELHTWYHQADAFIFASSCENMPNILIEAMSSGLPIACSDRGPMPEVLGEGGVYFDPESAPEIARTLESFLQSPERRAAAARESFQRAQVYSWKRCADETFTFLAAIARKHRESSQ